MANRLINTTISVFAFGCLVSISLGQSTQTAATKSNERTASSITGRVVNENGQPLPNATILVFGSGRQPVRRTVTTDETGRFVADALPRGSYRIMAQAKTYVYARDPQERLYYRPGETVSLTLKKGAAITGTVRNAEGEPVVAVPINAFLVRDPRGRQASGGLGAPVFTDDRGVYRIFGLPAGSYLVAASLRTWGPLSNTPYLDDSPTYYPSSTRDTAVEVLLQYGTEATGIDIRYRGEPGHIISGKIADSSTSSVFTGISMLLSRASNDALEAQTPVQLRENNLSFSFYGIADGDYYLVANRAPNQGDDGAASKRLPIKIRGRDVTGLAITLVPKGSIAGRMSLDPGTMNLKCETPRAPAVEETLITVQTDEADDSDAPRVGMPVSAPDRSGDFLIQSLIAGRYLLDARRFMDEAWYVRAITVPGPTNTPVNVSQTGITVRSGQRINGIRVVLGEGAASLTGRVVAEAEGSSLPDQLRVHLVPAEAMSANDTFRFFEPEIEGDGSFKLTNLAPGRYLLVTRQQTEIEQKSRRPLAWNATARAGLLRLAQAANTVIELKPCERVAEYKLRYAPRKEAPALKRAQ